jgi:hypothetical protein
LRALHGLAGKVLTLQIVTILDDHLKFLTVVLAMMPEAKENQ